MHQHGYSEQERVYVYVSNAMDWVDDAKSNMCYMHWEQDQTI